MPTTTATLNEGFDVLIEYTSDESYIESITVTSVATGECMNKLIEYSSTAWNQAWNAAERHMLAQPVTRKALRAALAEPAPVQEPVGWSITYNGSHVGNVYESRAYAEERMTDLNGKHPDALRTVEPLYAAPQAQQPSPPADVPMLTEILHAIDDAAVLADFAECWIKDPSIEGMHRLKNGGVKFRLLAQAVRQKAGLK